MKMNENKYLEVLEASLMNMDFDDKFRILQEWQDDNKYFDDEWNSLACFRDFVDSSDPLEFLDSIDREHFNTNDDYCKYTIYGWITGNEGDVSDDFDDNVGSIARWMLDNDKEECDDIIVDDVTNGYTYDDVEDDEDDDF